MLINKTEKDKKFESFGFRFKDIQQSNITAIHSIGWEFITSTNYDWDGLTRREIGKYVFQYTLSGCGMIRVHDKTYALPTGKAFLVRIPSNHRYYFPKGQSHWEFIYITLNGEEVDKAFNFIQRSKGHVISFSPKSKIIQLLFTIFEKAANEKITDAYYASSLSYSFTMELYRYAHHLDLSTKAIPKSISEAILFIKKNYHHPIGLDELVESSNISKYHFTRLFHKTTNMTPVKYLTKTRMDKAVEMLRNSDLSITEIAHKIGYSNGNYFAKVFRKQIGKSPTEFRNSKHTIPVDHIIID